MVEERETQCEDSIGEWRAVSVVSRVPTELLNGQIDELRETYDEIHREKDELDEKQQRIVT